MEDNKDNENIKETENEKEKEKDNNNNAQNEVINDEKSEIIKGENIDNNDDKKDNKKEEQLEDIKEEEKNNEIINDNKKENKEEMVEEKNKENKEEIKNEEKEEKNGEIVDEKNEEIKEEKNNEKNEGLKENIMETKEEKIEDKKEEISGDNEIKNENKKEEEKKDEIKEENKEENNKEDNKDEKKEEIKEEEGIKKDIIEGKNEEIKEENNKEENKVEKKEEIEVKNEQKKEEKKEENNDKNTDEKKEDIIEEKNENIIEEKNEEKINDEKKKKINKTKKEQKDDINENLKISNETNEFDDNLKTSVTMKIIDKDYFGMSNDREKKSKLPKDFLDDKNRCNTLTQKLVNKTKINANMKLEEFFTKKRHYLIMTDGGKPVYSRYGDEVENNSIFATISAMITKFTIFNNTDNYKEEINVIANNKNKIVFVKKGQLIFIALSKKVNDSVSLLHSQLEYIYNQLMSILTVSFYEKLEDNPSKCLTAMGGTEHLFEQIIQYSSNSFISLFNSYQIMNFINFGESRDKINKILEDNKGNSLYCILMTPYEIISFAHSNQIVVTSSDLILIQNLIFCTEMLRTQESYVPICLPGISDQGFLQLYSHFSEENIGIIFVTENTAPMCFMEFQQKYNDIYNKLQKGYITKIIDCMRKNNNIKGQYSLFKRKNKKKQKLTDETLINKLLNTIIKEKGIKIEEDDKEAKKEDNNDNNENGSNDNLAKMMVKHKTYTGTFNTINNINNINNNNSSSSVFNKVKYGVVLYKKYNQYIMFNFGMDYRYYDKKEKNLIHKYHQLYDIYNNYSKEKDTNKDDFYYIEKSNTYYNVIRVNDSFILICTFSFFCGDIEDIYKTSREIIKFLKKYENKYFIVYK